MLNRVVQKSVSAIIQIKAIEQYFPVVLVNYTRQGGYKF